MQLEVKMSIFAIKSEQIFNSSNVASKTNKKKIIALAKTSFYYRLQSSFSLFSDKNQFQKSTFVAIKDKFSIHIFISNHQKGKLHLQ